MAGKNTIGLDGSCPFSVSDNLKIETSSYDLNLEGIIIRFGSISGFRATDLVAPLGKGSSLHLTVAWFNNKFLNLK